MRRSPNTKQARRRTGLHTTALAMVLWFVGAPGLAAADQPAWQREWTVDGYVCPTCSPDDRAWLDARIGEKIALYPTSFINPFYENCVGKADYLQLQALPAAQARLFLGRDLPISVAEQTALAGTVRCDDPPGSANVVARLVIDGGQAYMLHDSGAILHLR